MSALHPISRIDQEASELYFRGFSATKLAAERCFEDVVFLLLHGRLPEPAESREIREKFRLLQTIEPRQITGILEEGKKNDARGLVSLAQWLERQKGTTCLSDRLIRFIALTPVIIAAEFRYPEQVIQSREALDFAANFKWMIDGEELDKVGGKQLEKCVILHMDDPNNPSLTALEESFNAGNSFSLLIEAALNEHIKPHHHGAGAEVWAMFSRIGEENAVEVYLKGLLAQGARIFGLGHRIYRTVDPRAIVLRDILRLRTRKKGMEWWFNMTEMVASVGPRLILEMKNTEVHPNVDLYNGIVYHTFGFPPELFTDLFAIARVAGWMAHIYEWETSRDPSQQ
ncbi:MAG: citrate/2-methylcitrate synthase [Candidatus Thorarchaeota archaeon]|nr:MAG: citrate/2-methylcitrate synthase [Candidatus Thorarchaeota archaeon]